MFISKLFSALCSASLNFLLSQLFSKTYIGETGQSLSIRIKEHKIAVQRGDTNNVYGNTTMHNIKWEDVKILDFENNWLKRKSKSHGFSFC